MFKNPEILEIDYASIKPSISEVVEIIGYTTGSEPSFVPDMVTELLIEAPQHVSAAGCYSIFEIDEIKISSGLILHPAGSIKCGSKIAKQMAGSDSFALFVATAGNSFDSWVKSKAGEGDQLSEFLCSSIGSVVADKVADVIQNEIDQYAFTNGKGITNRYSPGYCSWNVREQKELFDLLPAGRIGVTLTQSFLMTPIKSVSGIIGIGKGKIPGPYMCELCNMKDCLVKRAKRY